ncbi:MAG: metal ABC transporter ATP-binding protein [Syntrophobacteraceae bacterium]
MISDTTSTCALAPASLFVEEATVFYSDRPALQKISFCVPAGSSVAVIGPNGAGKSTLFKALMGLLPLQSGSISIHGLPLGHHKDCVAYMPQREEVDWRFPVSVFDVVMMGRYGQLGWFKRPGKKDRSAVTDCLEKLGIADLAAQQIGSLSGGQQQRVFLARALAQEPHIILMDEPFTGVDASTQETVLALFENLRIQHVTILASTHDLNLAATQFDQVLLLNRRLIAFGPAPQALTAGVVTEAFGGQVLLLDGALVVDRATHNRSRGK